MYNTYVASIHPTVFLPNLASSSVLSHYIEILYMDCYQAKKRNANPHTKHTQTGDRKVESLIGKPQSLFCSRERERKEREQPVVNNTDNLFFKEETTGEE